MRAAAVVALAALSLAAASDVAAGSSAHPCLVAIGVNPQPFNRNFNPYVNPLDFTWGGIYEPLVVVTRAGGGHEYLWLASRLDWSKDRKTLTITVDGKEVWTADLQKYGKFSIQFGVHWTPVLYKDHLYLQVMHRGAQLVVALEAATGEPDLPLRLEHAYLAIAGHTPPSG